MWTSGALAGLVSTVLYVAALAQSPLSGIATLVTPLPLYLAGLSSGSTAAAIGAAIVVVISGALAGPANAASYLALIGLPAVGISYLLLLNRDVVSIDGSTTVEWYPAGKLLSWLALSAAGLLLISGFAASGQEGGLRSQAQEMFLLAIGGQEQLEIMLDELQLTAEKDQLFELVAAILPTAFVVYLASMAAANAGLAQRLLIRMDRALRPSPRIKSMVLPAYMDIVLALSVALSLASGDVGFIGTSLAFVLMIPYFLLGLVVIHAISQRWPGRGAILALFYFSIFVIQGLAFLVAALGLMEQWFEFRHRYGTVDANQKGSKGE